MQPTGYASGAKALKRNVVKRSTLGGFWRARASEAETIPRGEGTGTGTGGVDRPFLDETGRLPDETMAPFAVGLGVAIAGTGLIFGPAPVIVGLLPLAWGAWGWLSGARAELDAQELDDIVVAERLNAGPVTAPRRKRGAPGAAKFP